MYAARGAESISRWRLDGHARIVDRVAARDVAGAREAMRLHVGAVEDEMRKVTNVVSNG